MRLVFGAQSMDVMSLSCCIDHDEDYIVDDINGATLLQTKSLILSTQRLNAQRFARRCYLD